MNERNNKMTIHTKSHSISSIGKNSSRSRSARKSQTCDRHRLSRARYESRSASTRENVRFFEDGEAQSSVDNVCRKKKKKEEKNNENRGVFSINE